MHSPLHVAACLVSLSCPPHDSNTLDLQCAKAGNGRHGSTIETLIIGGRGPNDRNHNPSIKVNAVQVYQGILKQADVTKIYKAGSPSKQRGSMKLDLRATDYSGSGTTWKSRFGPSAKLYGRPKQLKGEGSLFFDSHSQWAGVDLNTDGHDMPQVSYSVWARIPKPISGNLGWVMSQYPDHGWSRSITINDHRLSRTAGVSATVGGGWRNTLPKPPVGKWFHVVASWNQGRQTCVYLNGKKGQCTKAGNGKHASRKETLIIGGRGPNDRGHNPSVIINTVQVYKSILSQSDVTALFKATVPAPPPPPPPPGGTPPDLKLDLRAGDYTGGSTWKARVGPHARLCAYGCAGLSHATQFSHSTVSKLYCQLAYFFGTTHTAMILVQMATRSTARKTHPFSLTREASGLVSESTLTGTTCLR